MGYSNPLHSITYTWGVHDFGAGAGAFSFKGPKGTVGRLKEITVTSTETFNAVTTPAYVRIGTASDADAYAELNMGTTAATDTIVASAQLGALIDQDLPADTQIEVAFVAPTGGTPAGMGHVFVTVDWF